MFLSFSIAIITAIALKRGILIWTRGRHFLPIQSVFMVLNVYRIYKTEGLISERIITFILAGYAENFIEAMC